MAAADRCAVQRFYDTLGEQSTAFFNVEHGNELRTMAFFENGKPDHRFFVAQTNGEIAALAFVWDVDCTVPWFGIAVHDDFRRKGLGAEMMRYVLSWCRNNGYAGLLLRTAASNAPARKLYEKFDFEQIGMHPSGELLYLLRFHRSFE